ncbi:hypothetical protein Tco_0773823 [Tanacetum coccineum]|uniref:Uncharacterized protein n=1 Tax=Tanacetum coccineum TaxID=301880 RepID=A0ABQ4ZMU8_9ASTR
MNLKRHDSAIKGLEKKVKQLAQAWHSSMTNDSKSINQDKTATTKSSTKTHCPNSLDSNTVLYTSIISNLLKYEIFIITGERNETPKSTFVNGTFTDKVKRRIVEEQEKMFLEGLEKVSVNTPMIDTIRQNSDS